MRESIPAEDFIMEDLMLQQLIEENQRLGENQKKLMEKLDSLQRRNIIFDTMMNILNDGFLVVGKDGTIQDINASYCDYFGVSREQIIGIPVTSLIKNTKMIEIMEKDLTEIDAIHEFFVGQTASGERKVAVTRLPVKLENGEVFGSVALVKFSRYTNKLVQSLQEMGDEIDYYRKELIRHSIKQYTFDALPTSNQAYRQAKLLAERFAKSDLPILLRGETGVGKEVFANAIHNASSRNRGPFICINCTSIPADLLESELFGYEEGAFSGGRRGGKRGKFELANHGTLLLDEVGDMPPNMQVKLLRVMQNNVIEKIGSEKFIKVDVRIITATNQDLEKKIQEKIFRDDLYYRLNVLPVIIPSLRERTEDIPALIYACLEELVQKYGRKVHIAPEAIACLQRYSWPGNIRELRNVIGRAYMTTETDEILPCNLAPYILALVEKGNSDTQHDLRGLQEKDAILAALRKYDFNCAKTAKALCVHRATLYSKMARHNISIAELRKMQEESKAE